MSIITTELELANIALGKFGGAGNQVGATGRLANLNGTDTITVKINEQLPICRQRVITDLVASQAPFRETLKYADLGDDIKQNDVDIESISGDGATVTVVTKKAHGKSTSDTIMLFDIQGTGYIALNATLVTITVVDTTTFTFASTATGTHTADSGHISDCPEIGQWTYAFTMPSDFLWIVGQFDEGTCYNRKTFETDYPYEMKLNKDSDGWLLLTDMLSNTGGDSAYIGYVFDQTTYALWTTQLVQAVAVLLAAELCPECGRDSKEAFFFRKQYSDIYRLEAKRMNQSLFSLTEKDPLDYTGRNFRPNRVGPKAQLGTYVDGSGNRRDVY